MIKKIIVGTLLSSMALFALPNNEMQLTYLSQVMQKKAVVLVNMKLEGETKENFGKLYDEYQEKLMKHRISEIKLIQDYAANFNNMTNENSDRVISEWVTAEEAGVVLKKNYIAKFKKIMPSADVIRYFQIENRLQLMREMQVANNIPLAQPKAADAPVK